MPQSFETMLRPAPEGFGRWVASQSGMCETTELYPDVESFERFMVLEHDWRWAPELDGLIENQDGGRPYAFRSVAGEPETFAIIWFED